MKRRTVLAGLGATAAAGSSAACHRSSGHKRPSRSTAPCSSTTTTPFNRALLRFEELVKKYYGKPINFTLHRNSSLGLEKQYFEYMSPGQGGRLRHRLAGPHVDLRQGGALHRCAFLCSRASST